MSQVAKNYGHTPHRTQLRTDGYLVIFVIILSMILGSIGFSIAHTVALKYTKTKREIAAASAIYTAEAGISDTIAQLNEDASFAGYSTKKTFYSDEAKGKADYISTISGSGSTRKIVATGYAYRAPSDTTPLVERSVQVLVHQVTSTEIGGTAVTPYNAYAGTAGLTVSNNSKLFGKVSGPGGIYVKGKLTATGNSDVPLYPFPFFSSTPANIYVNNMGCLSGTTYPVACPSSEQPITISSDSSVNGIVCAPNQTANVHLITQPGLQSSCTMPVIEDATFDKSAYAASMTAPSKTSSLAASRCSSTVDKITWTDKTIYTGALDTSTRDCEITILGDVYIKGTLTLGNKTKLILPYALRSNPPTILVDGAVTLSGTVFQQQADVSGALKVNGAPVRIISFASSNFYCSGESTCTTRLASTARRNYETTANVQCINQCMASSSLLWSYHGTVLVDGDSHAGMVNGQGVVIRNNSSAGQLWNAGTAPGPAFGTGTTLPHSKFTSDILSGTSIASWEITNYRQVYN